ncbi:MerR family transcriptional regulator [Streptomonospora sp. S1-112]|uniref:MerR family transcriptional regulator n=1 Tax=Streptomonospora mangrovi TaxID=2883123 RepID=A0A9X3NLM2_9ACTN|nr:MerR family transcriptional regulator [Streptomonospora mangrovi]MDA0565727.1 MerR family transcriptional regulator [Streptomonospora mangrovi]
MTTGGVTIGQAAAFAGVTVKTVRHYHRLGLVAEPERDTSGYRRYRSDDLLRLVRVRTLAEAGVPLAEIGDLLDADAERFAEAVGDVHRRLTERIDELTARRDALDRLAHGDRGLLPEQACALLDRVAELGFRADYVETQREGLVLARVLVPDLFDSLVDRLERRLADPEYVELTKLGWEAGSWDADDPRLEGLAAALADRLLADRALLAPPDGFGRRTDTGSRYEMVNAHGTEQAPAVVRLNALIEARLRSAGIDVPRH